MVTITLGTCTYILDRVVTLKTDDRRNGATRIIAHETAVDYETQTGRASVMFTKTATGWAFSSNNLGTHYEGTWATLIDQGLAVLQKELEAFAKD